MCLSKALTGGTIPLAVTTATQRIFDGFYSDDVNKALFHGHIFMANFIGCVIALEAIRILESEEMQQNLKRIAKCHQGRPLTWYTSSLCRAIIWQLPYG